MNNYTLFIGAATLITMGFVYNQPSDFSVGLGMAWMGLAGLLNK